jgi:hypothetical protein
MEGLVEENIQNEGLSHGTEIEMAKGFTVKSLLDDIKALVLLCMVAALGDEGIP